MHKQHNALFIISVAASIFSIFLFLYGWFKFNEMLHKTPSKHDLDQARALMIFGVIMSAVVLGGIVLVYYSYRENVPHNMKSSFIPNVFD